MIFNTRKYSCGVLLTVAPNTDGDTNLAGFSLLILIDGSIRLNILAHCCGRRVQDEDLISNGVGLSVVRARVSATILRLGIELVLQTILTWDGLTLLFSTTTGALF
jgi:hypothetical protein